MTKVDEGMLHDNQYLWITLLLIVCQPYLSIGSTIATGFEASGDWEQTTNNPRTETTNVWIGLDQIDTTTVDEASTTFEPVTKTYQPYGNQENIKNQTNAMDDISNDDAGSINIIAIVGAICGVIGLLLGIIISAGLWLYISKKRMAHVTSIAKNPEEKTFERLDFNLTLPRDQQQPSGGECDNSSNSSTPKNLPPQESSYLHFDEPTPYETNIYEITHHHNTAHEESLDEKRKGGGYEVDDNFYKPENIHVGDDMYSDQISTEEFNRYLSKSKSYDQCKATTANRYPPHKGTKHSSLSSYNVLLQQDSSDQSSVSRMSSSCTGAGPRRSSSCTYRTDLPDSDGSNSSTCGGSISVTSSLAREKPCRGLDLIPSARSSYLSDVHTMSTRVPSSYTTEQHVPIHDDSEYDEHIDETSVSSSDLFIDGHENNTFQHAEEEDNQSQVTEEEDDPESSLSYFDLKLPPATFGNQRQSTLSTSYSFEEKEDKTLHRYSPTSVLSDEFTIKSTTSENTINL